MAIEDNTNDVAGRPAHKFSSKAKEYRLAENHTHSGYDKDGSRKDFQAGDKVTLEPEQYEAFKDKFEPLNKKDADNEDPNPKVTPTQPQEKLGEKKDAAPDADKTKPSDGATGAGGAANSTNVAKV